MRADHIQIGEQDSAVVCQSNDPECRPQIGMSIMRGTESCRYFEYHRHQDNTGNGPRTHVSSNLKNRQ
jgi:hypothetical protein